MAKRAKAGRQRGGDSVGGFFRLIFEEHPNLLVGRSNAELLDRWNSAHPGQPADKRIQAILSNVKSTMRKKKRIKVRRAKKAEKLNAPPGAVVAVKVKAPRNLELLEERIDDVLSMAKHLDRDGLEAVINHLRLARNKVVWKQGQ